MAFKPCTQSSYLALWRTITPASYNAPIEEETEGAAFDVPSMFGRIFERVEDAANTSQQAYYLKPHSTQTGPSASGPRRAVGTVRIARPAPSDYALLLPSGTRIQAVYRPGSFGSDVIVVEYRLTADATLAPGVLAADVQVEADLPGYDGNLGLGLAELSFVPASPLTFTGTLGATTATPAPVQGLPSDRLTLADVGRYVRFSAPVPLPALTGPTATTPRRITAIGPTGIIAFEPAVDAVDVGKVTQVEVEEFSDLGVTLEQLTDFAGGVPGTLDAIAVDRGTGRLLGESDKQLCDRLQELADIVSPAAISRITSRVLTPLGIPFAIKETRDPEGLGGFVFGAEAPGSVGSPFDFGGLTLVPRLPGSQFPTQGAVFLSEGAYRRYFVICVGFAPLGDFGLFFDATSPYAGDANAFDAQVPGGNFYDGSAAGFDDVISRLYDEINRARAAGIGFAIVRDPNL